ncbi:MAG: flagellar motor protein MotA [Alphaproteobacteria bacterium]
MTKPGRFLMRMALFLASAAAAVVIIWDPALAAFMANPALNGVIVSVFAVGVFVCVRQASSLSGEIAWIEAFNLRGGEATGRRAPRLLAPIARAIGETDRQPSLAATSTRVLMDGLGSRLDEARELARYLVGLLIFLGLLGTFWGLLETVRSVGDVVAGLGVTGDAVATFDSLKSGLRAPLDGMGTAFSSSLFGLAGAVALGFLDLQAGQAQNRFFNDVEDWLSGMASFHAGPKLVDGEGASGSGASSAYVEALLGQTAEALDDLRRLVARQEEGRRETHQSMARTGDRLHDLTDRLQTLGEIVERQQHSLVSMAEREDTTAPAINALTERLAAPATGDPETKRQLAQIERLLERLGDGIIGGQGELAQELRTELRLLGRTLTGRTDGPREG